MPPKKRRAIDDFHDDEDYVDDGGSDHEQDQAAGSKKRKARVTIKVGRQSSQTSSNAEPETQNIFMDYSSMCNLKAGHMKRPIWITPTDVGNRIYLEAFHPLYQHAYDRLVAVAEPISRPKYIHTYQLTENSLYAAVAVGITTESIIKVSH